MKIFLMMLIISLSVPSLRASASTNVGNGGLLVACMGPGQQDLQLLEFVEANILWNLPMRAELSSVRNSTAVTEEAVIAKVLGQLAVVDPTRAARLNDEYRHFNEDAFYIPNVILSATQDENTIALPVGCMLQQAVVQITPELPGEKRYNVSQLLWDLLQPHTVDRAGLILHELLYREAIANGQTTSKKTRYLNALLFSESFKSITQLQYNSLLTSVGFPNRGKLK